MIASIRIWCTFVGGTIPSSVTTGNLNICTAQLRVQSFAVVEFVSCLIGSGRIDVTRTLPHVRSKYRGIVSIGLQLLRINSGGIVPAARVSDVTQRPSQMWYPSNSNTLFLGHVLALQVEL